MYYKSAFFRIGSVYLYLFKLTLKSAIEKNEDFLSLVFELIVVTFCASLAIFVGIRQIMSG